jgi:hypothetical protein
MQYPLAGSVRGLALVKGIHPISKGETGDSLPGQPMAHPFSTSLSNVDGHEIDFSKIFVASKSTRLSWAYWMQAGQRKAGFIPAAGLQKF